MTFDEIKVCLEREGWPVDTISETTMRSRFQGKEHIFPLFVHLCPPYVMFAVIPFCRLYRDSENEITATRQLLKLNRTINMAKFSIDEDGDVILSVEYRLDNLDPSEVRDAVDVLSFYADKHYDQVRAFC